MLVNKPLQDIITFTRASAATRINSAGVMESVAANVPRIDYDPVTLAVRGILLEEQRTNLLLNSLIDGTPLATQSVTVTAVAHTLSFYGSGSVALSGAYTGNLAGAGAYPARNSLTFTPGAGTLTLTVTGDVKFAQCGPGAFSTSFIPTAGAQVTRAADVASINTLSPWYNQTEGTLYVEAAWSNGNGSGDGKSNRVAAVFSDGTSTTSFRIYNLFGTAGGVFSRIAGVTQVESLSGTPATSAVVKAAVGMQQNNTTLVTDGVVRGTDTSCLMVPVSKLEIGSLVGLQNLGGHIRKIRYFPKRLTNAELQALTA